MNTAKTEYTETLPEEIKKLVQQGHLEDETIAGIVCNYKPFSIVWKNDNKTVIGVLSGYTAFAEVYVDDIWVAPAHRKKGIGQTLLQELENRFRGKGYNNINLVTSAFQAPKFYKKCGFKQEFIRVNKQNPKLNKLFFVKYFNEEKQTQGILLD